MWVAILLGPEIWRMCFPAFLALCTAGVYQLLINVSFSKWITCTHWIWQLIYGNSQFIFSLPYLALVLGQRPSCRMSSPEHQTRTRCACLWSVHCSGSHCQQLYFHILRGLSSTPIAIYKEFHLFSTSCAHFFYWEKGYSHWLQFDNHGKACWTVLIPFWNNVLSRVECVYGPCQKKTKKNMDWKAQMMK